MMKLIDDELLPPIAFETTPSLSEADFIRSDSNAEAYDAVLSDNDWPDGRLIMTGPAKSGKTHLAKIWCQQTGAELIECGELTQEIIETSRGRHLAVIRSHQCVENSNNELLMFHLLNAMVESGGSLMLTSSKRPVLWKVRLPDLKSRIEGSRLVSIHQPDDFLLKALIIKLLADRQISVAPNVIDYILPRIERTYCAVENLISEMDQRSLIKGQTITRSIAASSLNRQS